MFRAVAEQLALAPASPSGVVPARLLGANSRELRRRYPEPLLHKLFRAVCWPYVHLYHRLEVVMPQGLPQEGPFVALTSHFSYLDVVALLTADPYYPWTTVVVKNELARIPVVGGVLASQDTVWVGRDGRDVAALRQIYQLLFEQKRGICIAAEGTRSTTGHLGSLNASLVKLVLSLVKKGVPAFPVVEVGTYEAMPKGAWLPRPRKIRVVMGKPIDFKAALAMPSSESVNHAASLIRQAFVNLLPERYWPLDGTPLMTGQS